MSGDLPSSGDASTDEQADNHTQATYTAPDNSHTQNVLPVQSTRTESASPSSETSNALAKITNRQAVDNSPQLSPCEIKQLDKLLASAPYPAAVSIDALKVIQQQRGWVSDTSLSLLSAYIQVSVAELDSVATFYNLIFRQAVGEVVLHPCDGISCDLMGGVEVRAAISQKLHINPGETTPDNRFTLIPLPCLGACDKAPVMIASKHVYPHLTLNKIAQLIDELDGDKK
ncbi:NADH dehydrogenase I, E subunit [Shewanella violacea DSS12]|uniref:NADH-quinone oxidoreductase subunit E n=2 Tax=Shewanella violacea TaxID=60217 RepID=D4ZIW3_SHEVD|nr:NADH dehydrogenase I, E subunit [Shewanella violacea DSS12]